MAKLDFSDLIPQSTGGGEGAKSSALSFDDLIPDNTTNAVMQSTIGAGVPAEVTAGERLAAERQAKYAAPIQGRAANVPLPPTGRPAYTLPTQEMPPVQPFSGAGESYREPFQDRVIAPDAFSTDQTVRVEEGRPTPDMMDAYRRRFGPDITEAQVMEMRRGAAREDIVPRTLGRALEGVAGAESPYFTLSGQESAEETARRREAAKQLVPEAIAETEQRRQVLRDKIDALEAQKAETGGNALVNKSIKTLKTQLGAIETDIKEAEEKAAKIERGPAVTQTQLGAAVQGAPQAIAEQTSNAVTSAQRILLSPVRLMEAVSGVPQDKSAVLRAISEGDEERRQAILGQLNSDVALADDLGQKVVRGIGSTAGFAATGGVLRAGLGLGMTAATAVGGSLAQGNEGWKAAEARAAQDPAFGEEWRKWASFAFNLGIGATEAAPIGFLFSRLDRLSGGGLTRWAGITGSTMGEEGLQEGLQKILENFNAIAILRDPNATIDKDVVDNMLVGALSGGAFAGPLVAGKMAFTAGQGALERQVPQLPLNMQGQPTEFSMAPVQSPLTAGVQAPGAVAPTAPVEAQGVSPSLTPPAATPEQVLAAAPEQAPERPALQALQEQAAAQAFPPTEPEVQVLLGAGFAPADIADMSPQERLAEIRAAKSEGVTPVELTPQQKVEFGFAQPQAGIAQVPNLLDNQGRPLPPTDPARRAFAEQYGQDAAIAVIGAQLNGTPISLAEAQKIGQEKAAERAAEREQQFSPEGQRQAEEQEKARSEARKQELNETFAGFGGNTLSEGIYVDKDTGIEFEVRRNKNGDMVILSGNAVIGGVKNGNADQGAVGFAAQVQQGINIPQPKAPAPKKEGPLKPSLTLPQFIASMGGIKDTEGELKARNLDRMMTGRYGPLVRPNGMSVEDALRAAIDAGYYTVPEREGAAGYQAPAEMLDQFYNDLGAKKRDEEDQRLEAEGAFDKGAKKFKAENRRQIERAISDVAEEVGLTGDPEAERIAADYIENGQYSDPLVALEQAITHLGATQEISRPYSQEAMPPEAFNEVQQGPAPQAGAGVRAGSEQGEEAGGKGAPQEAGAAAPEAGYAGPVEEAGAEGKPQLVIPGAEQISAAEQAKLGAEKPLKPSAPQKDVEGLSLFNDSSKQGDLLDMTVKAEEAQEKAPEAVIKEENKGINQLNKIFTEYLQGGGSFKSITEARKLAEPTGITDPKIIEEALELAIVRTARGIVKEGGTSQAIYDKLVDLYQRQPKLNTRTSESVMNQAYSTPIPLAYVASRLAGIGERVTVYEPTAGNGALLIEADPKFTYANELNRVRRANLKRQGFETVSGENAMNVDFDRDMSVIIANPPFGVTKDADGEPITFDMSFIQPGYRTREIDHAISLKALQGMEKDGRAVLIIGSVNPQASDRSAAYNGKAKREFFKVLYDNYNVADHFTVDGKLYDRQGASWPVDVIVIDGVGKSAMPLPAVQPPRILTSWDQVKEQIPQQNLPAIAPKPKEEQQGKNNRLPNFNKYDPDDSNQFYGDEENGWEYIASGLDGRFGANRDEDGVISDWMQVRVVDGSRDPIAVFTWRRLGNEDLEGLTLSTESEWNSGKEIFDDSEREDVEFLLETLRQGMPADIVRWFRDEMAKPQYYGAPDEQGQGTTGKPTGKGPKPTIAGGTTVREGDNQADVVGGGSIEQQPTIRPDIGLPQGSDQGQRGDQLPIESSIVEPGETVGQPERFDLTPPAKRPRVEKGETETEKQVSYEPLSTRGTSLGTLVPVNMRTSTQDALQTLADKRGSIDGYVADRLGYKPDELGKYFSAEQIDAIGLAIDNLERGAGFIIGDQTGIGKGRVNAAIIRYAIKTKRIPIFVTEKPNLYGDMYRDLTDIGIANMLGRDPKMMMTNSGEAIPLNDEGTKLLKSPGNEAQNKRLSEFANTGKIGDNDMVFTTYSQMQTVKGKATERQRFLTAIAPNSILILDESHNAGGQGGGAKDEEGMNRAAFVRDLVQRAQGVFYSSATYAKRPDVMDLYSKTDMALAVENAEQLAEAIQKGGIPMQQVVAAQLAEAGQYIRRERSFAGVTYDTPIVPVDKETYNGFSSALAAIQKFSLIVKDATKNISNEVKAEASMVSDSGSTGGAGAESTNFTAVMHNLINQMLLSMKANIAADMAIDTLKAGEKPVITVANTMESFLKEFQEETGVKVGDKVDMDFGDLLKRYLEKTRTITIRKPFQKGEKKYLTDQELGPAGLAAYNRTKDFIDSLDLSKMPISPIDALKAKLQKAGYKVGEITGRNLTLDYTKAGAPVLATRGTAETSIRGRRKTIADFNNGTLDAVILNQAGATGLSLHASQMVKDQRKRHMIIAQAEGNIDTHMQMLGRVHRTGQVVVPRYSQVIADIPAEKRPAAVLAKKMASLSANTTGARKGALAAEDVPDFMNKYGDRVAVMFLRDNPEIARRLDVSIPADNKTEDVIRKVTGRIPLLSLKEQEELYETLETGYKDLLEQLEAQGVNTLEAATLDLGAKLKDQRVMKEGTGTSPFTAPVNFGLYDVKRLGKPMDMKTAIKEIAKANDLSPSDVPEGDAAALTFFDKAFASKHAQMVGEATREYDSYMRGILDDTTEENYGKEQSRLFDIKDRWETVANLMVPGKRVRVVGENGESYLGVVVKVGRGGKSKNPLALSTWRATVIIPSPSPMLTIPFSQISPNVQTEDMTSVFPAGWAEGAQNVADVFNQFATSDVREPRVIVTGNILSGFDMLKGRGTIVNFTTDDGQIRQGIMLPASIKTLDDAGAISRKKLNSPAQVIEALQMAPGGMLKSRDGNVLLNFGHRMTGIVVPKAKGQGGKYYLDKKLIDMVGNFYSSGRVNMKVEFPNRELPDVVQRLMDLGAIFDGSESDVKPSFGLPKRVAERGQREMTDIRKEVEAIAKRVVGRFGQVSVVERIDQKVSERAAREAGYMGPAEGIPQPVGLAIPPGQDGVARLMVALTDNALPAATAYHEADHVLEMMGAFTPQETKIREVAVDRLRKALIESGLPAEPVMAMVPSEVLALSFELYGAGRDIGLKQPLEVGPALKRVFQKVGRFIEAVRNMLAGRGFRSVESLFDNAYLGRLAERAETQIEQSGFGPRTYDVQLARPSFSNEAQRYVQNLNAIHGAGTQGAAPQAPASFVTPTYTRLMEATRGFQDEFVMLLKAQRAIEEVRGLPIAEGQNAYMIASLMPGRVNARLEDFRDKSVKPIINEIKKQNLTEEDVWLYLYARHARERNELMAQRDPKRFGTDGGSGMMNGTADQVLQDLEDAGKTPGLKQVAKMVDAIVVADRELRLQSGDISQETYDDLTTKFKHYVPLRGFAEMQDGDLMTPQIGKGISVSKRAFKTATGRSSLAFDPLANVILQAEEGIIRAEKNRAAKALLRLAQNNPNPDLWDINKVKTKRVLGEDGLVHTVPDTDAKFGDNVVIAKIGGVPHYITLNSVPLAQAYKKLGVEALGPIWRNYAKVGRFFSQLHTSRNPAFFFPNAMRDIEEALYKSFAADPKLSARFVKNYPLALALATGESLNKLTPEQKAIFDEWRLMGGRISYNTFQSAEEISEQINRELGGVDPLNWKNLPQKTKDAATAPIRGLFKVLEHISQPIEDAPGLAIYMAARELGYSPNKSASLALESRTNFYRRGAWGPKLNALYWFYNASIQGTVSIAQLVINNKRARMAYASLIPLGFFMTMYNLAVSADDEEEKWKKNYSNIQDYERQGFIIIKTGKGQNDYVKIPLAFGLKIPYYLGEQMAMVLFGQVKPQTAAANVLINTVDAFNPLGKGSLLNLIAPSMVDPVVDLFTNRNFANRPIVPEKRPYNEGVPQSEQAFRSTSPTAVSIAQLINEATGGNKYRPGMLDLYPGWIEYSAGWLTGGLGRFTGGVFEWAKNSYEGVPTPIEKIPIVSRFVGPERTGPGESFRYYETRTMFEEKANEMRKAATGLKKNPSDQEARKTVRELGKELGGKVNERGTIDWQDNSPISVINKTDKMIAEYRKQLDAVKNNKQLTPVARDTRNRQIEGQIERVQKLAQSRLARFSDKERKPSFAPLRGLID